MKKEKSKTINNHFELIEVVRKASSYFVGSFTSELMVRQKEWENKETKTEFIKKFHDEYFAWDGKCSLDWTRNRINCVIRIIESGRVEDTLQYVIDANDKKMDIPEVKENAIRTLEMIRSGELQKRKERYDEKGI